MIAEPFDYANAIAGARLRHRRPSLCILDGWAWFLKRKAGDITSQDGEDGILAALFSVEGVGTKNHWCFEVGAADGLHLSNTWALRQDGWDAVLIERDPALFAALEYNCRGGRVWLRNLEVNADNLGLALTAAGAPKDMDLGVIDIDGPDLEVWRGLTSHRPRVVLIEFNPQGDGIQGGTTQWQAGLERVADLGRNRGYRLVARTTHNAFFVDEGAIKGNA